jgi:membrane-associated phospholipid phosphatase
MVLFYYFDAYGPMKVFFPILLLVITMADYGQESARNGAPVPFTKLFHALDKDIAGSFTYNYGLNYVIAGAGTYGIVRGGVDWKWYRFSNDHPSISNIGFASVTAGGLVPIFVPLGLYFYGRHKDNTDLQVTGLALGQAAMLGLAISSGIKVFTGRVPPDSTTNPHDYSGDFRFGFLRGGAFEGWPSSHTTIAFAMATTLVELNPGNTTVKIGSFAFASLIGLGVSTNIHWLSDAVAGGLIGYAIGKTIGCSYADLMNQPQEKLAYHFYVTPTGAGFAYRF